MLVIILSFKIKISMAFLLLHIYEYEYIRMNIYVHIYSCIYMNMYININEWTTGKWKESNHQEMQSWEKTQLDISFLCVIKKRKHGW